MLVYESAWGAGAEEIVGVQLEPGTGIATHVVAAGRPTPLWHVTGVPDDRAVFAGEARGLWLWAIVWPEQSGLLMYDELVLTDLRDAGSEIELLPCGALSPRIIS